MRAALAASGALVRFSWLLDVRVKARSRQRNAGGRRAAALRGTARAAFAPCDPHPRTPAGGAGPAHGRSAPRSRIAGPCGRGGSSPESASVWESCGPQPREPLLAGPREGAPAFRGVFATKRRVGHAGCAPPAPLFAHACMPDTVTRGFSVRLRRPPPGASRRRPQGVPYPRKAGGIGRVSRLRRARSRSAPPPRRRPVPEKPRFAPPPRRRPADRRGARGN